MATIDLGKLGFVNKGTYSSSTSYEKNDLVQYTDSGILSTYLYINSTAATGQTPSTSGTVNGTYWAYYAKGGSTYTSTLTTQGDILYHNGSGEARLGAGTSGQVLQTGGSGANPSWTTMTSDMVQIVSADGNGTGVQAFDSCFSSTYENYRIYASIVTQNTTQVYMRLQNASNTEQQTGYYGAGHHTNRNSSGAGGSNMGFWDASEFQVQENTDNDSDRPAMYIIDVLQPFSSALKTWVNIRFGSYDTSYFRTVTLSAQHDVAGSMAGFRFYTGSGNILSSSKFKIYGLK